MPRDRRDLKLPRTGSAARHRRLAGNPALERQRHVTPLAHLQQRTTRQLQRTADGLFVARHRHDNLRIRQRTVGLQRLQRIDQDHIAALDVVDARAARGVAIADKFPAGQHGVEVTDHQDALALGAFALGKQVPRPPGLDRQVHPTRGQAQGLKLGGEPRPHGPHAGNILARAVDLHRLLKQRGHLLAPRSQPIDDRPFLDRQRGAKPRGAGPRHGCDETEMENGSFHAAQD